MVTSIIIDTSVICHQIHQNVESAGVEKEHLEGVVKAQLVWLLSADWLGSLKPDSYQFIFVTDTKVEGKYWRNDYLLQPEVAKAAFDYQVANAVGRRKPKVAKEIHYKAGRKLPEYLFTKVKVMVYEILEAKGCRVIREPNYEADDLAAALVYLNSTLEAPNDILLITVDADWMGLISPQVTWFCSHGWYPRVRSADMGAVNYWSQKRLKCALSQPRDIWTVKHHQGDKSDNLPPGTPIEVIDLLAPPEQHRLWERPGIRGVLKSWLSSPQPAPEVPVDAACDYLRSLGVQKFLRPLDPDSDLYYPSSAA